MIDKKTIEVILKLKDQFSGALKSISTKAVKGLKGVENQSKKTNTGFTDMAKSAKTFIKVLVGLQILKSVVGWLNSASAAAEKYNISLNALNNLTQQVGISSKDLISDLSKASQAQVGMRDLVAISNRMIALLGREAVPRFRELAEVALKASQVMGTSVTTALNDLTIGIGRQSRMILDNLGLIVSAETANVNYAKALGISKDQLTFAQQKQAFMNEALTQAKQKYAGVNVVLSGRDGMIAAYDNFIIALGGAINSSGALNKVLVFMATEFNKSANSMEKDTQGFGKTFTTVFQGIAQIMRGFINTINATSFAWKKFNLLFETARMVKVTSEIEGLQKGLDKLESGAKTFGLGLFATKVTSELEEAGLTKKFGEDRAAAIKFLTQRISELGRELTPLVDSVEDTAAASKEASNQYFIMDAAIKDLISSMGAADNVANNLNGIFENMDDIIEDVIGPIEDLTTVTDGLTRSMSLYWDRIIVVEKAEKKLIETRLKAIEIFGRPIDFGIPEGKPSPPFFKPGELPKPDEFPTTGLKGLGANVNLISLLGTGIGAAGGGGIGIMQALLPAIGNIIAPGIGGLIGGGLSAIVGLFKKKRRGETPAEPVFTSDVNLQNTMTELLNAIKSQLTVRGAGGTQRVSVMLREQALAAGFS